MKAGPIRVSEIGTLFREFYFTSNYLRPVADHMYTSATAGLESRNGRGSNGGVWEWTSTLFDTHEGFSPTNLFTG